MLAPSGVAAQAALACGRGCAPGALRGFTCKFCDVANESELLGWQLDLSSLRQLVAKLGEIQRPMGVFADGPLLRSRLKRSASVDCAEESSFGGRVRAREVLRSAAA